MPALKKKNGGKHGNDVHFRHRTSTSATLYLHVAVSPVVMIENLFFAIFGQTGADTFAYSRKLGKQPEWTFYLFKISFSLYMLVTVIILINLLIAMMSDTYQSITSQSDLEWKYGLSKLIRNMQKTSTAPSPLNLFSAWSLYLFEVCKKRMNDEKNKKSKLAPRFFRQHLNQWISTYKKTSMGSIHKPSFEASRMREDVVSQFSFDDRTKIGTIVDWAIVRRKYRVLFGDEIERPSGEETDDIVEP